MQRPSLALALVRSLALALALALVPAASAAEVSTTCPEDAAWETCAAASEPAAGARIAVFATPEGPDDDSTANSCCAKVEAGFDVGLRRAFATCETGPGGAGSGGPFACGATSGGLAG